MIAALAGRRVDPPNPGVARFPPELIEEVEGRIRAAFVADDIRTLVCAAACGADLLALSAAAELRLRRRVILPFPIEQFRDRSVADREGTFPWGALYDRIVADAETGGDLEVLDLDPGDPAVFECTNEAILDVAMNLAANDGARLEALIVWDGRLQTAHDYTAHFADAAQRRNIQVKSIAILENG